MRIVSLAAVALASVLVALVPPGASQAADLRVDTCLDWKVIGFPRDYCVIDARSPNMGCPRPSRGSPPGCAAIGCHSR